MGLAMRRAAASGLKRAHGQISDLVLQLLEKGFFHFVVGNSRDGCRMRDKMRYFEDIHY